ncbi:MAG: type II toxin-antitoxin system PemK/MazF family toxin [Actinomycetota bacterium]
MVKRGELWWVDFGQPAGSAPGYRRPAAIVSSDRFNRSRIGTVVVAAITSNLRLSQAPGNVSLEADSCGLPKESVVNISQLLTIDRGLLEERIGTMAPGQERLVDSGLRLVLDL